MDDCCSDSTRFQSPIGTVVHQLGVQTSTPSSVAPLSPVPTECADVEEVCAPATISSGVIAGLAVEGAMLVLALAGVGYMIWRNRRLSQANTKLVDEKAELDDHYHRHWSGSTPNAAELAHYGPGHLAENREGRVELGEPMPELSGSPIGDQEVASNLASAREKSPGGGPSPQAGAKG